MADKENMAAENSEVVKAETEESKAAAKVAKAAKAAKKSDRPGFFSRSGQSLKRYFKDVRGETKKIVWPDAKTVLKSTGVVLLVVVVVSLIIWGIDTGLSAGITGLKKLATGDETSVSETVSEETAEGEDTTAEAAEGEEAEGEETETEEETKADEPDARGLLNGKFVDTRHISVELYDRNVDGGTEAGNNAWTKWIQEQMLERYNVKVSFVTVARWTEGDDINNLLAAGTAPDICYTYSYPTIQTYANMGGVLDLAPILEENKDLVKDYLMID